MISFFCILSNTPTMDFLIGGISTPNGASPPACSSPARCSRDPPPGSLSVPPACSSCRWTRGGCDMGGGYTPLITIMHCNSWKRRGLFLGCLRYWIIQLLYPKNKYVLDYSSRFNALGSNVGLSLMIPNLPKSNEWLSMQMACWSSA